MSMTTRSEIRLEILDHLEQLREMGDPEDLLLELADSNTPIYYGEIIDQWHAMPSEYNDQWQEMGMPENASITGLMQLDLYMYYQGQFLEVWEEVNDAEPTSGD